MLKKTLPIFLLLFMGNTVFSQKDSIVLTNNNRLVGEIKNLKKSVLTMKTSYSDSDFKLKWHRVKEIYSDHLFVVSLSNGMRMNATINNDSIKKGVVLLDTGGYVLETEIRKVILLDAIGKSFWSRVSAEFDMGIILTKANNSKQFTANAKMDYVAQKWSVGGFYNSVLSQQDSVADIKRVEGDLSFQRFLRNEWYLATSANFLSNNEQKLELRSTGKLGGGYYFKRNNSLHLGAGSGFAFNNESYTDALSESKNSIEVYLGGEFNKYDIGDLSLLSSIFLLPSITEKGRIRTDFKFDMKYDLPLDFYIKMGITYNYDNQPADGATAGDYVFQTSFGWELD